MAKKKNELDIEFEISFLEQVLRRSPGFVQALSALAELYTLKGNFQKGLETDLRLSEFRPDDPIVLYNLSCSYSLLEKTDASFAAMKKAIQLGYDNKQHLQNDPDLFHLRKDERFNQLLSIFKESAV